MSPSTQLDDSVMGDAELIAAARTGDAAAVGALYERHAGAAWVVARQYTNSPADADDVVSDSFAAVFGALQRGKGPESAFRAYLFTVVRRSAGVRREKDRRVEPTDDIAVLERGTAMAPTAEDPALAGFERGVVARAFHSLPERWQAVLWHTEVEGLSPAEIAPILGLTSNGVAALSYRAREGLRQAYLQEHLQDPLDEGCRSISGKLGSYVRGGLGSRETAQVESHLEDCGTCRGLVLELGDVNHGMRAVIAPLVLGIAGLGALGVLLPVGGGLAAGAAASGAASSAAGGSGAGAATAGGTAAAGGAGAAAAGSGGAAAAGTGAAAAGTGAAAAGAGAVATVGAATGAAAAGGVAAFIAAIPLGAAAAIVGGVALAAVATVGLVTLLSGPDDGAVVAGPTSSASSSPSSSSDPEPSADAVAPSPLPTDLPTDFPADDQADPVVDDSVAPPNAADEPVDQPAAEESPAPAPPEAAPAAVQIDLPDGGLSLEAGLGGQELAVGVRNTGGTAATNLVAQVTLPDGVTIDGISGQAFAGVTGRFAAVDVGAGWICTDDPLGAQCTLAALPPMTTSTLTLRVAVDDSYDGSDGQIGLVVNGAGITYKAPPIRVTIAASPARLALRTPAPALQLVSGRTRTLALDVANVGGSPMAAGTGSVTVVLPAGVTGALADGASPWACMAEAAGTSQIARDAALQGATLTCRVGALGARAAAPLTLALTAGSSDEVRSHVLSVLLAPGGRHAPDQAIAAFSLVRPAALGVVGDSAATVALGQDALAKLAVTNSGDLPSSAVSVTLTAPNGVDVDVSDGAWACSGDGTWTCTTGSIAPGGSASLPVSLAPQPGFIGPLGSLTVGASAADADAGPALAVAITSTAPVLSLAAGDPTVLLSKGAGTVSFTASVAPGASADSLVATLSLPPNLHYAATGGGVQTSACVPYSARRIICDFGTVPAGTAVQGLVNVTGAGSAQGAVLVEANATGAVGVRSSSTVSTSSGGLSPRVRLDGGWSVAEVGAPLLSCDVKLAACANALNNGSADNNSLDMVPLDDAAPPAGTKRASVPVSSSSLLTVPPGRQIAFAGLYWSGDAASYDTWSGPLDTAKLRGPKGEYVAVTGTTLSQPTDNSARRYYQSFADVTKQVAAGGPGAWSVADVAVSSTRKDGDKTYYAGWSLVVVYAEPGSDASVTVYDGGSWIGSSVAPTPFEFAAEAGTTARIGVVAWEGDRTGTGDRLVLGDTCTKPAAEHALTPQRWGGTTFVGGGVSTNAFDSTATGWRANNSLGTDAKGFAPQMLACDVSRLTASTSGDQYLIGAITVRTTPPAATDR